MIKIGVPSKGRLMEKTFDWFGAHGVTMSRTGNEREYSGAVEGIAGVADESDRIGVRVVIELPFT